MFNLKDKIFYSPMEQPGADPIEEAEAVAASSDIEYKYQSARTKDLACVVLSLVDVLSESEGSEVDPVTVKAISLSDYNLPYKIFEELIFANKVIVKYVKDGEVSYLRPISYNVGENDVIDSLVVMIPSESEDDEEPEGNTEVSKESAVNVPVIVADDEGKK